MVIEENILRRHDVESLRTVERGFHSGPVAEALVSAPTLDTRSGLSEEEFEREYRKQLRPVVLEAFVAEWPSVRTWSFEHLAERCGDVQVTVNSYSTKAARVVTFTEFVELLKVSGGNTESPLYLQEWYYQPSAPQLAADMPRRHRAVRLPPQPLRREGIHQPPALAGAKGGHHPTAPGFVYGRRDARADRRYEALVRHGSQG